MHLGMGSRVKRCSFQSALASLFHPPLRRPFKVLSMSQDHFSFLLVLFILSFNLWRHTRVPFNTVLQLIILCDSLMGYLELPTQTPPLLSGLFQFCDSLTSYLALPAQTPSLLVSSRAVAKLHTFWLMLVSILAILLEDAVSTLVYSILSCQLLLLG